MFRAAQARGRDLQNDYPLRTKASTTQEGIVASGGNLCQFFRAVRGEKRCFQRYGKGYRAGGEEARASGGEAVAYPLLLEKASQVNNETRTGAAASSRFEDEDSRACRQWGTAR